jgi:hypothetical protein
LNYVKKYVLLYMSGLEYWRIKIIRRLRVLPYLERIFSYLIRS